MDPSENTDINSSVNNSECQLVNQETTQSSYISEPLNCLREGDPEPNPNPETRNCGECPEPSDSGGGKSDPLVIDLNGDGVIEYTSASDSDADFDIDNDGTTDDTGWVGCNEGILFIDENGDGLVTNQSEFFGNNEMAAYEELALYDSNGDGVINADDNAYSKIMVWQDVNGDGISQENEMTSLATQYITEIGIEHEEIDVEIADNQITGQSYIKRMIDGIKEVVSRTYETFLSYFKK